MTRKSRMPPGNSQTEAAQPYREFMHYYQFNVGDYASHTRQLTPMEDLIYRRLLDEYYLHERPLNGSLTSVARQIGMREFEQEIQSILDQFFLLTQAGWINKRADMEIAKYHDKQEKASKAGKASAAQRTFNVCSTDVQLNKKQETRNNNQEPYIKPKTATATRLPDWLPEASWNDYMESRKVMKSPMTDRAKALAISKLDDLRKQGYPPADVLNQSIYNGWKGLFPLKEDAINKPNKESYHEQLKRTSDALCGGNRSDSTPAIGGTAERVD